MWQAPGALKKFLCWTKVPFLWTPTKDIFIFVSVALFAILTIFLLYDFSQIQIFQKPQKTTQSFTMGVLMFHTVGFFLGITSYVYMTQALNESKTKLVLAIFATVGHFVLFVLRVLLDILYRNFREEYYRL